jgi:hypothetical protein
MVCNIRYDIIINSIKGHDTLFCERIWFGISFVYHNTHTYIGNFGKKINIGTQYI